MRRRNGVVGDFPFSIFQMVSTISSINSVSGLQLQGYPQLFIYLFIFKIEVIDQLIIQLRGNEL